MSFVVLLKAASFPQELVNKTRIIINRAKKLLFIYKLYLHIPFQKGQLKNKGKLTNIYNRIKTEIVALFYLFNVVFRFSTFLIIFALRLRSLVFDALFNQLSCFLIGLILV